LQASPALTTSGLEKPSECVRCLVGRPLTRRRGARADRTAAHHRERARLRGELHTLAGFDDPDDYEGGPDWVARGDIAQMVEDRRYGDKVAPLMRWAERTVETDPALAAATPAERLDHFRRLLPPNLTGRHALFHVEWAVGPEYWSPWRWTHREPTDPSRREVVAAVVVAGRHGELNRRIRHASTTWTTERITLPPERLIDDDHPAPGVELPRRTMTLQRAVYVRYLAGAHDINTFAATTDHASIVGDLYREITAAAR